MSLRILKRTAGWLMVALLLAGGVQAQEQERERERERERRERKQQPAKPRELPAYIRAEHRSVLQRWLMREPDLQVATDKDCGRCEEDIAAQRRLSGPDYHPYYVVGDFNGDGRKDFAVVLIETESGEEGRMEQKFSVAVFNAPFSRRRVEPNFLKENLNLRDGGLFYGPPRPQPYRLRIGLFTNDTGLTLIPQGQKYIAQ